MYRTDQLSERLRSDADSGVKDPFVITPSPDLDRLRHDGGAAIDLRLGTWFTSLKQAQSSHVRLQSQTSTSLTRTSYVPFGKPYILHPRSFVLAVTLEWLRLPHDLTASVQGKSSWGRLGLVIATASGVHPGFTGCLTLELCNLGEIPIEIKPGVKICQLFVQKLETTGHDHTSMSTFDGLRRPIFRPIKLDDFAEKLSKP